MTFFDFLRCFMSVDHPFQTTGSGTQELDFVRFSRKNTAIQELFLRGPRVNETGVRNRTFSCARSGARRKPIARVTGAPVVVKAPSDHNPRWLNYANSATREKLRNSLSNKPDGIFQRDNPTGQGKTEFFVGTTPSSRASDWSDSSPIHPRGRRALGTDAESRRPNWRVRWQGNCAHLFPVSYRVAMTAPEAGSTRGRRGKWIAAGLEFRFPLQGVPACRVVPRS